MSKNKLSYEELEKRIIQLEAEILKLSLNKNLSEEHNSNKEFDPNRKQGDGQKLLLQNDEDESNIVKLKERNSEYLTLNEEFENQNKELIKAKEKAEESEKLLLGITDNLPVYIATVDKNTLEYKFVNQKFCDSFKKTREEIIGSHISKIIGQSNYEFALKYINEVRQGKKVSYTNTFDLTEGTRYINVNYVPGYDAQLNFNNILVLSIDVTELKQNEQELIIAKEKAEEREKKIKEQSAEIENFFSSAIDLLCIANTDGYFVRLNKEWENVLGYPLSELENRKFLDFVHPDDLEPTQKTISQLSNQIKVFNFTNRYRCKNGDYRWIEWKSYPYGTKIYASARDITQRILTETELRDSKEQLRFAFEGSNDGLWDVNMKTGSVFISPRGCEILGYKHDEMPDLVKSWSDLVHPDDLPLTNECLQAHLDGKVPVFEVKQRLQMKSGDWKWILSRGKIVSKDKNGDLLRMTGTHTDISERKIAEDALQQAEDNHKRFMDESSLGIRILTQQGRTVYVNRSLLDIYGFSTAEEFYNTHVSKRYTAEEYKKHQERKEKRKNGENLSSNYEISIISLKGQIKYLEVTRKEIIWDKVPHFQVIYQDISNRKHSEQELLVAKEKAEESDKLKSAFLQNMSHEVRTPLNAIVGFTKLMAKPNQNPEKINQYSNIISLKSDQLIGIITDVIEISQIHANQIKIKPSEFDIAEFLNILIKPFIKLANEKGINLIRNLNFTSNEYLIVSDLDKLKRIFTHLIDNAIKFTNKGSVEIICEIEKEVLQFTVIDTGIGISPEMQEVIFKPFMQVEKGISRKFGGNGLGLAIIKAYAELLEGTVTLKSEIDKGTTIVVKIGIKTSNKQISISNISTISKGNTILIAEDDYSNFQYLEELLDQTGIEILHAVDGQQAIDMFKANPDIILILMDIKMPVMDGQSAARIIKQFSPSVPIIAQTAYALENEMANYSVDFDDYITKPIDEEELNLKMKKYLK